MFCKRYYTNKDLVKDKFGRNYWLPKELSKKGHQCLVVAVDYYNKDKEILNEENLDFFTLPLKTFVAFKNIRDFLRNIESFNPDIVIGSGDSHLGYFAGLIANKAKVRFVFDVYDYYPSFGSNRIPFMKTMYYRAIKNADIVLCVSQNLKNHLWQFNNDVMIIENGVDTNVFHPMDKLECRRQLGLEKDDIVIGYFGSMEAMRGIHILLEACEKLLNDSRKIKLLLAGKNSENLDFEKPWIDYRGMVSQEEVAVLINASDVVTMPYIPIHQNLDYSNSCKTAEYMACEVPIVSTKNNDLESNYPLFKQELSDALCIPNDSESLKEAIQYQLCNRGVLEMPEHMTWENLTKILEGRLIKLLI